MKNFTFKLYIIITIFSVISANLISAPEEEPTRIFKQANELFQSASQTASRNPDKAKQLYLKAAEKYKYLTEYSKTATPAVFMNLGNSYYMAGDIGRALLNYHKAAIIDPADENVIHNLNYVRTQTVDEFSESAFTKFIHFVFFWHYLPLKVRIAIFALFYAAFWILMAVMLFRKHKYLKITSTVIFILSAIFAFSVFASYNGLFRNVDGVIVVKEAQAYQGDGYIYKPAFITPLHSGTEFKLLKNRGKWYYIQLPDGKKAWLPAADAELIAPITTRS